MQKLPVPSPIWKQYIEQGNLNLDCIALSPVISESWHRSRLQNVDPFGISENDLLSRQALAERMERCQELIQIATPIIQELFELVKGPGFTVLLTDDQGYILRSVGDPEFMEKARKIWLAVGANWREDIKGTNAIGTAITIQKPITVFSWEHFCRENHFLTCSAAPIFDPRGELLGILDVSGDYRNNDRCMLGMVMSAARSIQNQLLLANAEKELTLVYRQVSSIMEAVPDGFLATDQDGLITRINHAGSKIFGLAPQECIGQPLVNFFHKAEQLLDGARQGKEVLEQVVSLNTPPGVQSVTCRIRMVADYRNRFYGTIASIRKIPPAQQYGNHTSNTTRYRFNNIIGKSPAILEAKRLAGVAAGSTSTVLLQGKTGTGKEMFAQAIHNAGERADQPFIAINCGAIPPNLIESELFGYYEGAFTGAKKTGQAGKFELADGGTIFLDEISEIPLQLQVSLLRVLEERQVVRIGGHKIIPVDIRVIAATNKDLYQEALQGAFRLDLYYRLNVLRIDVPSLQQRKDDIPDLARHFLHVLAARLKKKVSNISPEVLSRLQDYAWPGNVRELENLLERAVNLVEADTILLEHLPPLFRTDPGTNTLQTNPLSLRETEARAFKDALERSGGNITKAAKLLGIGRTTLYRKMKELRIK